MNIFLENIGDIAIKRRYDDNKKRLNNHIFLAPSHVDNFYEESYNDMQIK